MKYDVIWRQMTSTYFCLKVIFRHFSSKIVDSFFWKIQNVKNRHKSSNKVIIRREQRFSSKFVINDASCQMTSFDVEKTCQTSFVVIFHQFSSFDVFWRQICMSFPILYPFILFHAQRVSKTSFNYRLFNDHKNYKQNERDG